MSSDRPRLPDVSAPFRTRVKGLLRDQLLEATLARAADEPWDRLRMADVAGDVGVSRQTVYNEFGSKDGLAAAAVQHEVRRVLTGIAAELERHDDLAEAVEATVTWVLDFCHDHRVLQRLLADSREGHDGGLLPLLTTRADAVVEPATAMLLVYAQDRWPERMAAGDGAAVVDVLVRHIVSHVVLPAGEPADVASGIALVVDRSLSPCAGRRGPPEARTSP